MQPAPTGRLVRTGPEAYDLILTRRFAEPPRAVWASFADPAQAAPWFGRWEGAPGEGQSVDLQLLYEEGRPWSRVQISECTPPEQLRLLVEDEFGGWDLEIRLRKDSGGTLLEFIHHLEDPLAAESVGPGWEYYLDRLAAVRSGGTVPGFEDYYPGQGAYFRAQAQEVSGSGETA